MALDTVEDATALGKSALGRLAKMRLALADELQTEIDHMTRDLAAAGIDLPLTVLPDRGVLKLARLSVLDPVWMRWLRHPMEFTVTPAGKLLCANERGDLTAKEAAESVAAAIVAALHHCRWDDETDGALGRLAALEDARLLFG